MHIFAAHLKSYHFKDKPPLCVTYPLRSRCYCQLTSCLTSFCSGVELIAMGNQQKWDTDPGLHISTSNSTMPIENSLLSLLGTLLQPLYAVNYSVWEQWNRNLTVCYSVYAHPSGARAKNACLSIVKTDSNQSSEMSLLSFTFQW